MIKTKYTLTSVESNSITSQTLPDGIAEFDSVGMNRIELLTFVLSGRRSTTEPHALTTKSHYIKFGCWIFLFCAYNGLMLYFSELLNRKVFTEDNIFVGKLGDLVFKLSDSAEITKVVVKAKLDPKTIVDIADVVKLNGSIVLKKNYHTKTLEENELYVSKNLLDSQVIDISGDKMVRVNDVAIQNQPILYIAGVDIGLIGFLRWFGLEDLANKLFNRFGIKLRSQFLSWVDIQTLELSRGHVKIKTEQTKLQKIKPEDLADYLEQTNMENIGQVLRSFTLDHAGEVLNNLNLNYQVEFFKRNELKEAAHFMSHMEPEEAADVLVALPKKKREGLLELLNETARNQIEHLLSISVSPVGDIVSTEFLTFDSNVTAKEVLKTIKELGSDYGEIHYVFFLNTDKQMVGGSSLRSVIIQQPDTPAFKFMRPQIEMVSLSTPVSVVWKKLLKYQYNVLPVVDKNRQMIGLVKISDVGELINK